MTIDLYNDSGQWVKSMSTILAGDGLTQLDGIVQQLRGTTLVIKLWEVVTKIDSIPI